MQYLKNISVTLICFRCNKLDICHVPVHSDVLPSVCPDTPKYLEAQYECVSNIMFAEEVRLTRLPRLGVNISDIWSDRKRILDDDLVEDALDTVIDSQQVQITEDPMLVSSEIRETKNESTNVTSIQLTSVNFLSASYTSKNTNSLNNTPTRTNQRENTTSLPLSLRNSSFSDNNCVNKNIWQWVTKEVIIIILISSQSIICIILTAAIIIIKVKKNAFLLITIL